MNKIIFKTWSIIGIITIILACFQMFIMTKKFLFLFLLLILSVGLYFAYLFLGKQLEQKNTIAKGVMIGLIIIHFLPLLFQFFGSGTPRIDTVILASIGTILYWKIID